MNMLDDGTGQDIDDSRWYIPIFLLVIAITFTLVFIFHIWDSIKHLLHRERKR